MIWKPLNQKHKKDLNIGALVKMLNCTLVFIVLSKMTKVQKTNHKNFGPTPGRTKKVKESINGITFFTNERSKNCQCPDCNSLRTVDKKRLTKQKTVNRLKERNHKNYST